MSTWLCRAWASGRGTPYAVAGTSATPVSSQEDSMPRIRDSEADMGSRRGQQAV